MGHKINPETFRLGTSIDWKYQLRDPLLANITIYKTIKKMFMEYSAPYISNDIRRQTNPRGKQNPEKRKNTRINNPFLTSSFFFSHINISYVQKLQLSIFLYDEHFEKKRVEKGVYEKSFFYLSGKFFSRDSKHDFFFQKEIYKSFKNSKKFRYKNQKWKRYIYLYKNKKIYKWKKLSLFTNVTDINKKKNNLIFKDKKSLIKKFILKKKIILLKEKKLLNKNKFYENSNHFTKGYSDLLLEEGLKKLKGNKKVSKENKKKFLGRERILKPKISVALHSLWLLNTIIDKEREKSDIIECKKNLKKLKILIRLLPLYLNKNKKEKFFFFIMILQMLHNLIFLIEKPYIKKKILIFSTLMNLTLVNSQYKIFSNKMHIKLKKSRFLTFNLYSKIITYTLQKTCFINGKKNVEITYLGMANKNVSASLLCNMLIIQLGEYINFKQILRNMTKKLQKLIHIQGFRIILSGRLTRKERAAYIIKNYKSIPLSSYSTHIDYSSGFKIMKFGCVGIKIYLRIDKTTQPPYWYTFRFENYFSP